MTKLCVSAGSPEEAAEYLNAGADLIAVCPRCCAMSALEEWEIEAIRSLPKAALIMNRLFFESEKEIPENVLKQLDPGQTEIICFSDPFMVPLAEKYGLKEKLIYKPETLAVSTPDALWWRSCGIRGNAVSPLLTRDEIVQILRNVPGCMVTVHGRLLMSVSGRKLLKAYREESGVLFDESSRYLFLQETKRDGRMPVYEKEEGTYIYTDFVQESSADLKLFEEAGADIFYIESLGCTKEETADAVKAVRAVMNGADAEETRKEYALRHPSLPLSEGYYGQKTIR